MLQMYIVQYYFAIESLLYSTKLCAIHMYVYKSVQCGCVVVCVWPDSEEGTVGWSWVTHTRAITQKMHYVALGHNAFYHYTIAHRAITAEV